MIIRGCRGTVPVCSTQFVDFGGCSTSFSVNTPEGLLLIDAGTGIKSVDPVTAPDSIYLLFTHYHVDHISGLPVFAPLYYKGKTVTLMGDPQREDNWRDTLSNFMTKPYWPIGIADTPAKLSMEDLVPGGDLRLGDVRVTWMPLPHPQGCLAFRIDCPDYSAVIATDVEFPKDIVPDEFSEFASGATFLIFDAQYHPAELLEHQGWGHSSWRTACRAAADSGARNLILTHHAPDRTDLEIRDIERLAKKEFTDTVAGSCGMTIWPQI